MGKGDKRLMNDGLFCIVYSTGITLKRKREKIKRKAFDKIGKKKKEKQITNYQLLPVSLFLFSDPTVGPRI